MMTKKDFIRHCAETSGCTIKETGEWLEFFLNEIIEVLKTEDELRLNDVGRFTVSEKPVRQGRNPSTGEPMMIPAHKAVKFKVSKVVKDAVK